jgi:hypothetical protein
MADIALAASIVGAASASAALNANVALAGNASGLASVQIYFGVLAEGGTLGRGTGGTAPVGSWSLGTTTPVLESSTPANGATGVPDTASVVLVWTVPDGIDPYSLQVTIAGQPAVAGGAFYSGSYGGSIVLDADTATITISTHPNFNGSTTISTTATSLHNVSQTANTTFQAVGQFTQNVADTVTVSDALATHDVYQLGVSDTVPVTDALRPSVGVSEALSDSASVLDALVAGYVARPPIAETVPLTEAAGEHQVLGLQVADTVPIADQAIASHQNPVAVSDAVSLSESLASPHYAGHAMVSDTVTISESLHEGGHEPISINESVALSEAVAIHYQAGLHLGITVPIFENFQAGSVQVVSGGTTLTIGFPFGLRVTGTTNPDNFRFAPVPGGGGFPFSILSLSPVTSPIASGAQARVVSSGSETGGTIVQFTDGTFTIANVGDYITLGSRANMVSYLRILQVLGSNEVVLDKPLIVSDPQNGAIPWTHTSAVTGVVITTTKQTGGAKYNIDITGLIASNGSPFSISDSFTANATKPQVTSVELLEEGQLLVTFSDNMLDDEFLTEPGEYSVTGPTTVRVESVQTPTPNQVLLMTSGMGSGSYTLTVNANGTPHDLAGNPIDPIFNQAVFTGATPLAARSIFVDQGPIAKAPNILQTGTQATVVGPTTINLADGNLSPSMIGLLVKLTGGTKNGGTFLITSVPSATRANVTASFTLPDSTVMDWQVFDPRDGEIADDPSDVTVTINGAPTPALDVVGLLGQIVLATPPNDGDQVSVNYNWVQNPVIELRRLNSKEFRFNSWNRDLGYIPDASRHKYRYNNTLVVPSEYVVPTPIMSGTGAQILTTTEFNLPGATLTNTDVNLTVRIGGVNGGDYIIASVIDATHLTVQAPVQIFPDPGSGTLSWQVFDPDNLDERALLPQPLQRDLKYRAYERAYTALLNDPSTLLFNSPTNKIAFPPLQRPLSSVFVNYQATGLPQNDPVAPWTLHGSGTATIVNDELVVTSSSAGLPFPSGQPIFWTRPIDLTFPHVFASSWRLTINAIPTTEGIFTGVASGFSDGEKCCVVGFLDNAGTRMLGILKSGSGNDPSQLSAWIGGVDGSGNATNAPVAFDWSTIHSYRLYQDQTGTISVFVDGGVVATLTVPEASLPFLSELNEPFNQLQGIYFGAMSRLAISTSTWDFLRYEILPINPQQVAPSVSVSYEADRPPEIASQPWTPIGAHGTETIPHTGLLILDSTSATDNATEVLAGLIDGDFRGFDRIEPLLSAASSVAIDVNVQLLTWTHGISPNSVMVAVDDSNYLIQLCFFPGQSASLFSYGGRSLPDQFEPYIWTKLGGQTPKMIGQFLQITDASTTDGLLYAIDDNPTPSAPNRVVSYSNDYMLEFRVQVVSHTPDPGGFSGVNAEVYDSLRDLGVYFLDVSGTFYVAFHSEGTTVAQFPFNWNDGNFHTYRLTKNTSGNLVSLFIDTVFIGTAPYSSFSAPSPSSPIGVVSFGSTTPQSTMALSVVNWAYCNAWRVNPVLHHYVGIWKGFDPNALTGYHLPLKTIGRGARVAGNGLEDLNANFVADGVVPGDVLIVDVGPNKGVYEITSVSPTVLTVAIQTNPPVISASASLTGESALSATAAGSLSVTSGLQGDSSMIATAVRDTTLIASSSFSASAIALGHAHAQLQGTASVSASATVNEVPLSPSPFPVQPSRVDYRIPNDVDWTFPHRYRIVRDPGGGVALFIDNTVQPAIDIGYNNIDLPPSAVGLPEGIAGGLPSVVWGAFDPTNLSQTAWQYVRYGITRPAVEAQIVPPHQILNQRNIMQSYERHLSNLPHTLTDFWSESEGITPQTDPDFLENPNLVAYTLLNEGTPLVPSTQTYEVRRPTPVLVPVVGFNNIQDLMNSQSFVMNESEQRIELMVPPDVLYNSLQVIEHDSGEPNLIAPFNDESQPYSLGAINYQETVCLTYDAETLPENDPTAITPWTFQADQPINVIRNVAGGVLTYGTNSSGAQTVYANVTPLPDAPSLTSQVTFRLKLVNDASGGLGDSQVRFGLSAPGMTASLAFVTVGNGQRYVLIIDQNSNTVVGGLAFDFLDGNFHTYRIVRNPTFTPPMPPPGPPMMPGLLQVFIDS